MTKSSYRSAFKRNNSNKLVSEKNNTNYKINEFNICNNIEITKMLRKSKSQKLFQSKKIANSRKKNQKIEFQLNLILKKFNQVSLLLKLR